MEHVPYEKMDETTANWDVQHNKAFKGKRGGRGGKLAPENLWIVTEKVHGANLCIVTDGQSIKVAKRTEFLKEDDDFFGYTEVIKKYSDNIKSLFPLLQKDYPKVEWVSVYGELFGGAYPHPDVKQIEGATPVQTGIYYCPHLAFYAFDIAVKGAELPREYVDYDKCIALFKEVKLFFAAPLFTGSYEECLEFNIHFQSTIPSLLGFPQLQSNFAEGVVIKPMKTVYVQTPKGQRRAIVKKKIEAFEEKVTIQESKIKSASPIAALKEVGNSLVTKNRLNNVISKYGRVTGTKAQRTKLQELLVADVMESLSESHQSLLKKVGKDAILPFLNEQSKIVIDNYFDKRP